MQRRRPQRWRVTQRCLSDCAELCSNNSRQYRTAQLPRYWCLKQMQSLLAERLNINLLSKTSISGILFHFGFHTTLHKVAFILCPPASPLFLCLCLPVSLSISLSLNFQWLVSQKNTQKSHEERKRLNAVFSGQAHWSREATPKCAELLNWAFCHIGN